METVQIENRSCDTFKYTVNADFMYFRCFFSIVHHYELLIKWQ